MYGIEQATRDARRHVLSRTEESKLHTAYLAGDHAAGQRLVTSFLPVLRRSAYAYGMPKGSSQDLLGVAVQAFLENLFRYDPARGYRLWSYIRHVVKHAVSAHAHANSTFFRIASPNDRTAAIHLDAEKSRIGACGRPLTDRETQHMADIFAVPACVIHGLDQDMSIMRPESLRNDRGAQHHGIEDPERVGGHLDFEMRHDHARHMEMLSQALETLDARQREIIARRFKETPDTLQDLSDEMGISRERVRQIESQALHMLRQAIEHPGEKKRRRTAGPRHARPEGMTRCVRRKRSSNRKTTRRQATRRLAKVRARTDTIAAARVQA